MPREYPAADSIDKLRSGCRASNLRVLASLSDDAHADAMATDMAQEACEGLMTSLMPARELDLDAHLLSKRYGIVQGTRVDGTTKLRAVDDMSESGCNMACEPTEKLKCNGIDELCAVAMMLHRLGAGNLKLWKADIAKAYRRVPVDPADRWATWVCLSVSGIPMVAQHNAMPFGAVGEQPSRLRTTSPVPPLRVAFQQAASTHGTV